MTLDGTHNGETHGTTEGLRIVVLPRLDMEGDRHQGVLPVGIGMVIATMGGTMIAMSGEITVVVEGTEVLRLLGEDLEKAIGTVEFPFGHTKKREIG